MFINSVDTQLYDYQIYPYIEKIDVNYTSDATFNDYIDVFDSLRVNLKKQTELEEIFSMYGECTFFSTKENENLMKKIRKNNIGKKLNIFDYYD